MKADNGNEQSDLRKQIGAITFTIDGHLLHAHKTNFVQRHSLDTWPDFESAKKAFDTGPGQIGSGEPE